MKKIMFNDKFLLTKAVLNGTKTMTRRVIKKEIPIGNWQETEKLLRYKIGEVVAIAQCYLDIKKPQFDKFGHDVAGNTNKMFVRADLMPHHIKITDVRVERLQDISDDDCLKEGVWQFCYDTDLFYVSKDIGYAGTVAFPSSREAFWYLINKICGKGTFERNPWVEAYTFTRVD
ncbi:hypothetical protein [Hallella colorans]|uniref:hypothetical protein n=1 Tax=Hallella colorans TaxID=1703337 RepID=UPI0023F0BA76|nr:hypothetical protein [Hallella colorans]